jgi:hypothetical protein
MTDPYRDVLSALPESISYRAQVDTIRPRTGVAKRPSWMTDLIPVDAMTNLSPARAGWTRAKWMLRTRSRRRPSRCCFRWCPMTHMGKPEGAGQKAGEQDMASVVRRRLLLIAAQALDECHD